MGTRVLSDLSFPVPRGTRETKGERKKNKRNLRFSYNIKNGRHPFSRGNPEFSGQGLNKKEWAEGVNIGYICVKGPAIITAKHLKLPKGLKCIDPEKYLLTLADDGFFYIRFAIQVSGLQHEAKEVNSISSYSSRPTETFAFRKTKYSNGRRCTPANFYPPFFFVDQIKKPSGQKFSIGAPRTFYKKFFLCSKKTNGSFQIKFLFLLLYQLSAFSNKINRLDPDF